MSTEKTHDDTREKLIYNSHFIYPGTEKAYRYRTLLFAEIKFI
jgi:hypothetical protein